MGVLDSTLGFMSQPNTFPNPMGDGAPKMPWESAGNLVKDNPLLDWAKEVLPEMANAALAASAACTYTGSLGNISQLSFAPRLNLTYTGITDIDYNREGHPVMAMKQLKTLPGFILVQDGDLELDCTEFERQAIEQLLEGGFYYE